MKKSSSLVLVLFSVAAIIGVTAWSVTRRPTVSETRKTATINVVASFYPLAHFAAQVGGDRVAVTNVTPAGAEPHDYEPTSQQVASFYGANLFVFNGGVENWAVRLQPSLAQKGVRTLEMDTLIGTLLPPGDPEEKDAPFDPHFWLDPVLAQAQVEAIRAMLSTIDPAHADAYRANADAYIAKLQQLDQEYKTGLQSCQLHVAVTSHAAFAYLGKRYGFTQLPITGLSPDEEPSAGKLAEIAAQAKAQGIKYIFFETLVNPQLAETIAREIGAKTLVFNPLEGLTDQQIAAGENYLTVMRENLANLRIALQCR